MTANGDGVHVCPACSSTLIWRCDGSGECAEDAPQQPAIAWCPRCQKDQTHTISGAVCAVTAADWQLLHDAFPDLFLDEHPKGVGE